MQTMLDLQSSNRLFESFREHSSAGSEHLPYKQRVGGSNPSAPTDYQPLTAVGGFFMPVPPGIRDGTIPNNP
jgi:hypothetical protein